MKKISCLAIFSILLFSAFAQTANKKNSEPPATPKLVVGIVVDQMAYEFLYKYSDVYSDNGFKRLLRNGFSCEETHYNYIPTYTGPGHTCIYTGSVPAVTGIISNDWYDRNTKSYIYCSSDKSVQGVGTSAASVAGMMSPRNMLVTSICDQLKLSDNQLSKVIGIALKDRGAIFPAGHTANAAYWYDGFSNAWVTSTYYMSDLPQYIKDFNAKNYAAQYLKGGWNLLLPADKYWNATADNVPWEGDFLGNPVKPFPHLYPDTARFTETIKGTPFGNSFTVDFAKTVITNEHLGKGNYTDFVTISFSSTDYVGHNYGPNSLETEDTYIRFDRDLAGLIDFLDQQIGENNYLLFLTADHGVAPAEGYADTLKIPSGFLLSGLLDAKLDSAIGEKFGNGNWVESFSNQQVYLNDSMMHANRRTKEECFAVIRDYLLTINGVSNVFMISDQSDAPIPDVFKSMFNNSIYPKRSGDIQVLYDPFWLEDRPKGTTHGTHYAYDTHVPLLFYGWQVPHGKTYADIHPTDIAPTIAAMLHITEPNGCVGKAIEEVLK